LILILKVMIIYLRDVPIILFYIKKKILYNWTFMLLDHCKNTYLYNISNLYIRIVPNAYSHLTAACTYRFRKKVRFPFPPINLVWWNYYNIFHNDWMAIAPYSHIGAIIWRDSALLIINTFYVWLLIDNCFIFNIYVNKSVP